MNFAPLLKDATTTTGTGNITTIGAAIGFQSLTAIGAVGSTFDYTIRMDGSAVFEEGVGTLLTATTFSRAPSNGASPVNLPAGTKDVILGPTAARAKKFDSGTSARVVFTSSLCVSDADLSINSTTFGTDQRAKLQTLLDLAIAGPLVLVVDGAYSAGGVGDGLNSLRVRSNTTIQLLPGCGIIKRNQTNCALLSNYNRTTMAVPTITDKNIRIEGPGVLNGNSANQVHDNGTNGFVYLLDFVGVDTMFLGGGISLVMPRTYAGHWGNWKNVTCDEVYIDCGATAPYNTDGLHFNGPGQFLTVTNIKAKNCADDAIAINADDAYQQFYYGPYATYGDIRDVEISDIDLDCIFSGIRLYCGGSRLDRVSVKGVRGKTSGCWIVVDNYVPGFTTLTGPGNMGTISIEDACVENTPFANQPDTQMSINCKIELLIISNINRSKFLDTQFSTMRFGEKVDIGQLHLDKIHSYPFLGGSVLTRQIEFLSGAKVTSAMVTNSMFGTPSAVTGYPIVVDSGVTIGQMTLIGNTANTFTDFVGNQGNIGALNVPATSNFNAASILAAGTATIGGVTATTTNATASEATGGIGPYAHQWFRSTASGTLGAAVSGQTTLTLNDSGLTTGTAYFYTMRYTDSVGTVKTSNQITMTPAAGASTWTLGNGFSEVSPTALNWAYTGGAPTISTKATSDAFGGNVQVKARVRFGGNIGPGFNAYVLARGSNTGSWGSFSGYIGEIGIAGSERGMYIGRSIAGSQQSIATIQSTNFNVGADYELTFTCKGSLLSLTAMRVSDGWYMQNDGTFGSAVNTLTVTDTSIAAGSNKVGLIAYGYGESSSTEAFTNFSVTAAP